MTLHELADVLQRTTELQDRVLACRDLLSEVSILLNSLPSRGTCWETVLDSYGKGYDWRKVLVQGRDVTEQIHLSILVLLHGFKDAFHQFACVARGEVVRIE